jgi:hypothetical protein
MSDDQRMDIWEAGYRAGRGDTEDAVRDLSTHNGTPVTPENLRYASTHEALCRSWIFDVLTGLADALDHEEATT